MKKQKPYLHIDKAFLCYKFIRITGGNIMTENEAIVQLVSDRNQILIDPTTGEKRTLEQIKLGNEAGYKLYFAYELAIKVLQEIQLYRKLDTEEKCGETSKITISGCVTSVPKELLNTKITEQEAVTYLVMDQDLLLFDALTGDSETPEMLRERDDVRYNSYLADEIAIRALQTISHYRKP